MNVCILNSEDVACQVPAALYNLVDLEFNTTVYRFTATMKFVIC